MTKFNFSRRSLLVGGTALGSAIMLSGWTKSRRLTFGVQISQMKPGDYTWAPESSARGSVVLIVSLPEQRGYVYRGGSLIAVTTCATGRKGHRTPTGVFSVLQKDKDHVSSTYKGAKMPYMERLTWSGIALHAGNLPGYPASHGCIRLPYEFSQLLFGITHLGVAVVIADAHSEPQDVVHPGLFLPAHAEEEARMIVAKTTKKSIPPNRRHESPHRPAKVLISVADKTMTLFEDGHIRAVGPVYVKQPDRPIGNHMFVLKDAHDSRRSFVWSATSYGTGISRSDLVRSEAAVLDRITTDRKTADALHNLMHPGLVMVITDDPAPQSTRSSTSFVIATHNEPADWKTQVFRN